MENIKALKDYIPKVELSLYNFITECKKIEEVTSKQERIIKTAYEMLLNAETLTEDQTGSKQINSGGKREKNSQIKKENSQIKKKIKKK